MIEKPLKQALRKTLPIYLIDERLPGGDVRQRIFLYGMQRSGQHVVINWICAHAAPILHVNHCRFHLDFPAFTLRPVSGRYVLHTLAGGTRDFRQPDWQRIECEPGLSGIERVLYNIEDCDLGDQRLVRTLASRSPREILVLRDPRNWLASTMAHGRWDNDAIRAKCGVAVEHYRILGGDDPRTVVQYEAFVVDPEYRKKLAGSLGLNFDPGIDAATLGMVKDFGGGSSFTGLVKNGDGSDRVERWRAYENDPVFQELLVTLLSFVDTFS